MRKTSQRRVSPSSRPQRYAGAPPTAAPERPPGPLVAREGMPAVTCPECGLSLRATRVAGRIPTHTVTGHRPQPGKGHPACPGSSEGRAGAEPVLPAVPDFEEYRFGGTLITRAEIMDTLGIVNVGAASKKVTQWIRTERFPTPIARREGTNAQLWDREAVLTWARAHGWSRGDL